MASYYIGLDVGQKQTAICVIDKDGKKVCEGGSLTRPFDIYGWIKNRLDLSNDIRVGMEAGTMSNWLASELIQRGLSVMCMETFQAHRFLGTYRNKTDKNDARGLAQLLRMGGEEFVRVVAIRSQGAQEVRTLLSVRSHLVEERVTMENHIAGVLKPYGAIVARGSSGEAFYNRVEVVLADLNRERKINFKPLLIPSLEIYMSICRRIKKLTQQLEEMAEENTILKKFMEIPGVGPITALSFYTAIDYPERFKKSSDVGAYFGLTPKQFQSGEMNFYGKISKRGDPTTRKALVQAATCLIYRTQKWCSLKAWGVRLAKRIGFSKARIAVARKLATIMHKIWLNGTKYEFKKVSKEEIARLQNNLEIPELHSLEDAV